MLRIALSIVEGAIGWITLAGLAIVELQMWRERRRRWKASTLRWVK